MNYVKYDTHIEHQVNKVKMQDKDGKIVEKEINMGDVMIAIASCSKCGATLATQPGMIGSRLQEAIGERKFLCECGEICYSMPVINVNKEDAIITEVESDGEGQTNTDNKDTN